MTLNEHNISTSTRGHQIKSYRIWRILKFQKEKKSMIDWIRFWPFKRIISDEISNKPLMIRYFLTPRIFGLRLVVHHFLRSDNNRHYHDHPWNFKSIILKGGYIEHHPVIFNGKEIDIKSNFYQWDTISRPKEWKHWVELKPGETCYTLVLLYGKRRGWGFWTKDGWISYLKYSNYLKENQD